MKFNERAKLARERAGLTQTDLAERISGLPGGETVKQATVARWEKTEAAGTTYIAHLAMATNCDYRWLATGQGSPDEGIDLPYEDYPIVEWDAASETAYNSFSLKVKNNANEAEVSNAYPSFKEGDTLLLKKTKTANLGDFVLVESDSGPIFGRLYGDPEGFKIHFINNAWSDITFSDAVTNKLIAVLTEHIVNFKSSR